MIEIKDLSKTYNYGKRNAFLALDNINLKISDGEFVAITGKSGAGKSTLLHIMGAIDSFESGSCMIDGTDVKGLSEGELARLRNDRIGIVMQDYALIEDITAAENIGLPLHFKHCKRVEYKARVSEAMEIVGITELARKQVRELSGGQKQRVAIARAIVNNPSFILADEPTGALDTNTGQEIMDVFKELNDRGRTVIIITHDMQIAEQCDRKIEIEDGIISE